MAAKPTSLTTKAQLDRTGFLCFSGLAAAQAVRCGAFGVEAVGYDLQIACGRSYEGSAHPDTILLDLNKLLTLF